MKTCQDFLITYGGHAKAAGFRVKNEDLETFKNRLSEYFKK
jgi:single-stranded DNA-specific DHH superfamily exonuclease